MKYVLRHIATTGLLGAASAVCGLCAGAGGQSAASAAGGRIRRTRHPASQPGHAAAACGAAHCRRLDRPDSAAGWGLHSTVHQRCLSGRAVCSQVATCNQTMLCCTIRTSPTRCQCMQTISMPWPARSCGCSRDEAPGSLVLLTSFVRAARDVFLGFPLDPPPTRVPPPAEVCTADGSVWLSCTVPDAFHAASSDCPYHARPLLRHRTCSREPGLWLWHAIFRCFPSLEIGKKCNCTTNTGGRSLRGVPRCGGASCVCASGVRGGGRAQVAAAARGSHEAAAGGAASVRRRVR